MNLETGVGISTRVRSHNTLLKKVWKYRSLYIFIIPSLLAILVFSYIPMFGILIAFQKFNILKGFFKSEWVWFKNFEMFLKDPEFYRVFLYTIKVSITSFIFCFPAPIILALLLNELNNRIFKRAVQTVSYMPYFLSWVVSAVFVYRAFEPEGIINQIFTVFDIEPVGFLGSPDYFVFLVIISAIWKNTGWGSIIYLASISGISIELYEAANIDGAGKWKQMIHITLPGILPTVVILGLYSMGGLLSVNFEQVFNLQNDLIRLDTNVIQTYVYYKGIMQGEYSVATAIGLLQAGISFFLLSVSNRISKRVSEISLW